jgi:hypothetical protein
MCTALCCKLRKAWLYGHRMQADPTMMQEGMGQKKKSVTPHEASLDKQCEKSWQTTKPDRGGEGGCCNNGRMRTSLNRPTPCGG